MLLLKLLQSQKKNKNIYLNNKGNHYRDFTYINNVNIILDKLMKKKNTWKPSVQYMLWKAYLYFRYN